MKRGVVLVALLSSILCLHACQNSFPSDPSAGPIQPGPTRTPSLTPTVTVSFTTTFSKTPTPSPTSTVDPGPTNTPSVRFAVADVIAGGDVTVGGSVSITDYGLPVTYALCFCNDDVPIGSAVTILDTFTGSDYQFQGWGWNGVFPYEHSSGLDPEHPFTLSGPYGNIFTMGGLASGCATVFSVYQNTNWANDSCQSFVHNSQFSLPGSMVLTGNPETIVMPCPTDTPSPTPTDTGQ